MRTLYLECFSGISGNMFLGALLDLGLPEKLLRQELAKLAVDGYDLRIERVQKQGISAVYVDVQVERQHHHRHLPDINRIIDDASLSDPVQATSKKIFRRLAEAEAKVHGTAVDQVHFHEVGAVDSIVDIVGAAVGLDYFGIEQLLTSRLVTGTGYVLCSHGRMPVPAPATAELLCGIPYESGEIAKELVTPTGAALVAVLSQAPGSRPPGFRGEKIGYGAGTWDLDVPNVLRATLGQAVGRPAEYLIVETNIDDLNPELYDHVQDRIFAAGARDVWLTPIIMKKGRPATKLSVLLERPVLGAITAVLFDETTTIGLRYYPVERMEAERKNVQVTVPWGSVSVKVGSFAGRMVNVAPEYEDCRRLAQESNISLKVVYQAALAAAYREFAGREGRQP